MEIGVRPRVAPARAPTLRILQVSYSLSAGYGGPAHNSFGLHRAFNSLPGVEATIVTMRRPPGDGVHVLFDPGAGGPGDDTPTRFRVVRRRDLPWELLRTDRVVLHGYYAEWPPLVAAACLLLRIPYFITPHGSLTRHHRGFSQRKKWLYERVAGWFVRAGTAGFIVGSEIERDEVLEVFPRARVRVGGAGTDVRHGPRATSHHHPLRLVSISRIAAKKRIDVSIDTVAALRRRGVEAVLTVAGSGDPSLSASLADRARSSGVADAVRFVGPVHGSAKDDLLASSDVFVLPSEDENFGIAFVEALAHSLPCAVTRAVAAAGGLDRRAVAVVDGPCPEEMADAVVALVAPSEPARQAQARLAAHRTAVESFHWRTVGRRWVGLLCDETIPSVTTDRDSLIAPSDRTTSR